MPGKEKHNQQAGRKQPVIAVASRSRGKLPAWSEMSPSVLSATARKGLEAKLFYEYARYFNLTDDALANLLNISSRTISNYRDKNKLLDPVPSEHLLKLYHLFSFGETILGNIEEFNYWLRKPFWGAEDAPLNWLVTPGGVDLIHLQLSHLAEGYPV